jgi:type IV pilus assembly protein PilB
LVRFEADARTCRITGTPSTSGAATVRLRKKDDAPVAAPAAVVVAERPVVRPAGWRRLGELVLDRGLGEDQLADALVRQSATGKRLGRQLVELDLLGERDLADLLAEQLELPRVDLRTTTPSADAVALLSDSVARALQCVPVEVVDGVLLVAVADPSPDLAARLQTSAGTRVHLGVAPASEVSRTIDNVYRSLDAITKQVQAFQASGTSAKRAVSRVETVGDDAPVVQVVNMMITQALRDRASDVHIEPQDTQLRVRFRIDGALHEALVLPEGMGAGLVSRIKIMAGMNIVERRKPQDGQIAMEIDGRSVDIRVASAGTVFGEKVVLRILDKTRSVYRLSDLGMPEATHDVFSSLIHSPFGMVVCAGPTGSGKTTTLYSALSEINDVERNITTIEDPVEYVFPTITQMQINEAAGVTFAGGLRSILRQDPDVILVGEIRDVETGRIAVQSALTGHLVLSSLHATDAVSALYRFLDMGIESFLVASSVRAVVGQRLLRRICDSCRAPYEPTAEELRFYREAGGPEKTDFTAGRGCNFCADTGYVNRIGVYELMQVTEEMRQLIVEPHPSHDEMRALAVKQGMRSLREQGADMVQQDVTTIAEVVRTIYTI